MSSVIPKVIPAPFPPVSGQPVLIEWRWQLAVTLVSFVVVAGSLLVQQVAGFERSLFFWPPGGITLGIFLLRGRRLFPGVLAGHLVGYLCWLDPLLALLCAAIGTAHAALGCTLIRWAWPRGPRYVPSTRFFAIMIVAGALIPATLTAWPAWYFIEQHLHPGIGFRAGFLEWWMGDCASVIVFTPAVLLLRPSFRENGWRSVKSMLWALGQIALCVYVAWLVLSEGGPRPIMAITVLIVLGCVIALRCGVIGAIFSNMALLVVAAAIQAGFPGGPGTAGVAGMQTEFDAIIFEATAICLLVAGGFYDYWRADRELHRVSSRVLKAQEIERRRLSSDLHDGASQAIFGAIMRLRLAASGAGEGRAGGASPESEMEAVASDLSAALKDLRRTVAGLRPEMLDRSAFADVLADYCAQIEERSEADVLFSDETGGEAERLPLEVREHLFRLVQEAVSNALQHGRASVVEVTLSLSNRRPGWLRMRITDNGSGFDLAVDETKDRLHLGLRTMEERALLVGGALRIDSSPGRGTVVAVKVPLAAPAQA
ncbi:signal transduction histidine kinase [Opitutaceae bacterium TAV1]|nr:signal transduction histidine kinase [Opitutaceae bacterium TAV1]